MKILNSKEGGMMESDRFSGLGEQSFTCLVYFPLLCFLVVLFFNQWENTC